MSIGYACLVLGVPDTQLKTVQVRFASPEKLGSVIEHNLSALKNILLYNASNNIDLFRISSDIIPLATHEINKLDWHTCFAIQFKPLANIIKESGMRVSMHPGQYTVLNSPNRVVADRAIADIEYHTSFLDVLEVDATCKIILHVGGVYGDKAAAMQQFVQNYCRLSDSAKSRLVIENDERNYNISDVIKLSEKTKSPVIFDTLHHQINPPLENLSEAAWIKKCEDTWQKKDGKQKIHYSQQNPLLQKGAHSHTINHNIFHEYYLNLPDKNVDIMLEVKDKNLSAVKCSNIVSSNYKIETIENEWAKYKYFVLSRSQTIYNDIRELLKEKNINVTKEFYDYISQARSTKQEISQEENAFLHVWGYFKNTAYEKEKERFFKNLKKVKTGDKKPENLKRWLYAMAVKYKTSYLLNSLYFFL